MDFVNKCTPKIKDKNHILFFKIYFFPVLYLHCFSVFSLVLVSSGHSGCGAHASHCNGFSSLAAEALERTGFSSFTSWAVELWLRNLDSRLNCLQHVGSQTWQQPTSLALPSGFFTTYCRETQIFLNTGIFEDWRKSSACYFLLVLLLSFLELE